ALVAAVAMMPMTYMQAKTWENTQSLFLHLIQVDPTSAIAKNNLGFLLISRGMLPEALIMVEEALAENPDYVDALVNKGVIKGRQGKLSESEAALRRAIEIDPESAQAHFNLGGVYFVRGQWAQAEAQYNETLRINPYHEDAKRQLEAVRQKI
ncbi:tetratricopeptide repeat protein, partial [Candidatus Peregrinibacteria bacterium]|nr:tetratricopeptide repeat protein [Candidatus Peregrinibacteria bacterium]